MRTSTTIKPYPRGTRIKTLLGDQDTDEDDAVRYASPGEVGEVTDVYTHENAEPYYSVTFEPSGVWVFLDHCEVIDPAQYEIVA